MSIIHWHAVDDLLKQWAAEGKTVAAMAARTGIDRDNIRKRLLKLGVYRSKAPPPKPSAKPWSDDSDRRLLEMDARHVPHADMANELGRSVFEVRIRLHALGKQQPVTRQSKPATDDPGRDFSIVMTATRVLGNRLVERKGEYFLDGRWVSRLDIIKAAHATLSSSGKSLPGTNPDKWL